MLPVFILFFCYTNNFLSITYFVVVRALINAQTSFFTAKVGIFNFKLIENYLWVHVGPIDTEFWHTFTFQVCNFYWILWVDMATDKSPWQQVPELLYRWCCRNRSLCSCHSYYSEVSFIFQFLSFFAENQKALLSKHVGHYFYWNMLITVQKWILNHLW